MKNLFLAGAAAIGMFASTGASAHPETNDIWRVMTVTGQVSGVHGGATADSFPIQGGLDDCRHIALKLKDGLKLTAGSALAVHCLNTTTGEIVEINTTSY